MVRAAGIGKRSREDESLCANTGKVMCPNVADWRLVD
jgi:hypothetical protein